MGTPLGDETVSSHTEGTPLWKGGLEASCSGDSIIRTIERGIWDAYKDPNVTVWYEGSGHKISSRYCRLVESAGEKVAIVMHIGNNGRRKCR